MGCQTSNCPRMPENFQIHHEVVGVVNVSIHAWRRFYIRSVVRPSDCKLTDSVGSFFAKQFCRSFARSQEVFLNPKYEVLRILNNDFRQARYFYDRATDTRFVLQEKENRPGQWFVVTAERPK